MKARRRRYSGVPIRGSARINREALGRTRDWVRGNVTPGRFFHIQGVVLCVRALARRHGANIRKAEQAAWLHDAAREWSRPEMLRILKGTPFRLDPMERKIPDLWHPAAGAALAWKVWKVRDREVLEAIRCHALGGAKMGLLARVLFVADYMEPGRTFRGVEKVRRLARNGLREGVLAKCEGTLAYLTGRGLAVHPKLLETWKSHLVQTKRH